ncbi:MAG: CotH kinase family protein, partial [Clostridia bacterium]|nr:CotH kinase family protein [Clostridia bacterium]
VCVAAFSVQLALPTVVNARPDGVTVAEVDISISAEDYLGLITEDTKVKHKVSAEVNGAAERAATINIRGNSSKTIGRKLSSKRIPFELVFSDKKDFDSVIANKDVKFINCFLLYRIIAEFLALDLFASMDIPVPDHELSFISFNGVDFGLYLAVEDTNGTFVRKNYGEKKGCLYKSTNKSKEGEVYYSDWFEYVFVKSGEDAGNLEKLIDALESGSGYEEYVNVDEWLRYFACVSSVGGAASILDERHNFILFDNDGVFDLIPWDLSDAFCGGNSGYGIDHYDYTGLFKEKTRSLFDLFMSNPEYKEKYHGYIREICEGFLSESSVERLFSEIVDALEPYIPRDRSTPLSSPDAVERLLDPKPDDKLNVLYELRSIRENLLRQLDGEEDTFFVNPAYEQFYKADGYDAFVSQLERLSPEGCGDLPDMIIAAADGRHESDPDDSTVPQSVEPETSVTDAPTEPSDARKKSNVAPIAISVCVCAAAAVGIAAAITATKRRKRRARTDMSGPGGTGKDS